LCYFYRVPTRVFIVLFLSLFLSLNQEGFSQIKLLNAKVVSAKDSSLLVGVHVVNMNTLNATNSYSDGTFLMPYQAGDTIRLTSIGYEDKFIYTDKIFIPDAIEITIFMNTRAYKLDPVDVNPYGTKEEFADEFKKKSSDEEDVEIYEGYDGPVSTEEVATDLNAHISLGSPISFFIRSLQ
jgi:hypothetical protein